MNQQLPLAIVGSGGAAIHALHTIRRQRYSGDIHLFSEHTEHPYNPMLLTYYLAGKIPLERCLIGGNDLNFYKQYRVNVHTGSPVVALNMKEKKISNAAGETIEYKACLIASGASALRPSFLESDYKSDRVFTFRTLQDVLKLREFLVQGPKKVLIVGASMIGIKLVEIFQEAKSEVYLVDMASHVFPLAAHPDCAALIENQLTQNHVRLLMSQKINSLEESKRGIKVNLSTSDIEVDLVIFCIGVKPNLDFVRSSDLQIDQGIMVDPTMRASEVEVYAAGDVAQATNLLTQKREVIPLWANACHQGRVAGSNMAGVKAIFPGSIPQNITHFFNQFFVSIGDTRYYDDVHIQRDTNSILYTFRAQGKKVGLNLLSFESPERVNTVGILRHEIIRNFNGGLI